MVQRYTLDVRTAECHRCSTPDRTTDHIHSHTHTHMSETLTDAYTHHMAFLRLEMWTNAQRDGHPAEHRWRPLFNATKFG